ncbi:oligopeptidase A, Metallo peptidase, MEROPS family M03A [Nitrosococcus oceani ATCC 19707]|uniref:oligopeptidase A n=2 Tax=Nitrosococcus oceani TaxID=1229 RepID=Q3JEK8_NITOC|nr:oligopeptidase A [Nitrosococcus oceani]ABA56738.1 oligopeptidase A, Metallo peptidase, MEROPS family M03A [Nitrosococcus oceani ATCC 19707]KFI20812.1 oligopeptidase A [Nitrosococcus oceani C-27]GEM20495.1 oligopeptidase A [Nitrosococcus oceani]
MSNPLLEFAGLPPFSKIQPAHVEPAIDCLLAEGRALIEQLLTRHTVYTWDNLAQPLEDLREHLDRVWSPVSHMNAVVNSDGLRRAYNACLPKLSEFATELGQNENLYRAFQSIAEGDEYPSLNVPQKKIIVNALRDFRLSGVTLPSEKKARFKAIQQQLASLNAKFEENLLDSTQAWRKHLADETILAGLPEGARAQARQAAEQAGLEGWLLTLEAPSYVAVTTYADDRELREEIYTAFVTRGSDQGPHGGRWDNTQVMEEILALRHEAAQLLGFANHAECSLATKMAGNPQQVLDFLNDLAVRSKRVAEQDLAEVRSFAQAHYGIEDLQAWDVAYYGEKLRQHKYAISQEELKPYFPVWRVLEGLFTIVNRLYGLEIQERKDVDTWHPQVRFFDIFDDSGELRGQFYLDLYARSNKRGGAWMADCLSRKRQGSQLQIPVAYLTCNLTPPVDDKPALFTHNEVITLFHEFGHGLHHLLTKIDYPSVAGISGVFWDAVELPSQFMENWCWQQEALALIACHFETHEPLPEKLFERMLAAKNFLSGMMIVRQLEFALFDFRLHLEYDPAKGARVDELLQEAREQVAVVKPPSFNRFAHSFSHIFAGGYAAGYYSYKWAEVLSADAFSRFEEEGIFDRQAGRAFMSSILEQGGSRDPLELFIEFRGREPVIDALLRHSGIAA